MKISFVIPTVEAIRSAFDACLPSLLEHHGHGHEVIVIDDGSDASSCDGARRFCEREGVRFTRNERNVGFARTVNQGIHASRGEIVVLVNSDIRFTTSIRGPLFRTFGRSDRIGVVGGLLLFPDGTIQHAGIRREGRYFTHRGYREPADTAPRSGVVLGCTGALLALRRDMIDEIGVLDETLGLSCEDVEYCLRAWSRGWSVHYCAELQAIHEEGGTRGASVGAKLRRSVLWSAREWRAIWAFRRMLRRLDLPRIEASVRQAETDLDAIQSRRNTTAS